MPQYFGLFGLKAVGDATRHENDVLHAALSVCYNRCRKCSGNSCSCKASKEMSKVFFFRTGHSCENVLVHVRLMENCKSAMDSNRFYVTVLTDLSKANLIVYCID